MSPALQLRQGERDGHKASGDVWHHRFDATSCSGRRPCQRLVVFSLLGPYVLKLGSLLHFSPWQRVSSPEYPLPE